MFSYEKKGNSELDIYYAIITIVVMFTIIFSDIIEALLHFFDPGHYYW